MHFLLKRLANMGKSLRCSTLCLITALLLTATAQGPFDSYAPPGSNTTAPWHVTQVVYLNWTGTNVSASTTPERAQDLCTSLSVSPTLPEEQRLTCEGLKQQMNTTNLTTGDAPYQGWHVQCDLCQEADDFTKNHTFEVHSIALCAEKCRQFRGCGVNSSCCRTFMYLPMASPNSSNCFLSSNQNNDTYSATRVNATIMVEKYGRSYVGAALVSRPSIEVAPRLKGCKLCNVFQEDLNQTHPDWLLFCHLDITYHDMGVLPGMPSQVDNVSHCVDQCIKRLCPNATSQKDKPPLTICCQAITYVYDGTYDQNCWLKTGLTLQSVGTNVTKQWSNLPGCVNTMSAWPQSFDWCTADPQCRQTKEVAADAKHKADEASKISTISVALAGAAFLLSLVIAVPKIFTWLRGKPAHVVIDGGDVHVV